MTTNRYIVTNLLAAFILLIAVSNGYAQVEPSPEPTPDPKIEKKRKKIRDMAKDTLKRLYKNNSTAKNAVESAYGYAVFRKTGIKILVAGSGRGQGVAVINASGDETFMKMLELKAGLGFGVKKFRIVFVFENKKAMNGFVNSGWEFGGQSDAAFKAGEGKGASVAGAVSVSDGIWMYQLTDKGVALELTGSGAKYSKDKDLNK